MAMSMLDLIEADAGADARLVPKPLWPGATEKLAAEEPGPDAPSSLHDPRPDLESDSALWQQLLRATLTRDGEKSDGVYARLHACRCMGARLFRSAAGGYRIQPDERYLDGAAGWAKDRAALLAPEQAAVTQAVKGLRG